jgi:hypothetical protein
MPIFIVDLLAGYVIVDLTFQVIGQVLVEFIGNNYDFSVNCCANYRLKNLSQLIFVVLLTTLCY